MAKKCEEPLLPPALRERLTQGQCVAYVGAGFSMVSGMPGWKDLLSALHDQVMRGCTSSDHSRMDACAKAIKSGRFDVAGSMLRDLLLPADFDGVMQNQFGVGKLAEAPSERRKAQLDRLRSLAGGPWAGIVTTNYDTLIETALFERVVGSRDDQKSQKAIAGFGNREIVVVSGNEARMGTILARPAAGGFFVKVHGSISGADVVLSTEDYDRVYLGTPLMTSFLTALMLRYHLVFIGCSLEDEMVRLRRKLAEEFSRLIPVAYALLPDSETNRQRAGWLRNRVVIECIMYQADELHTQVGEFLKQTADSADWALRRDSSPTITGQLRDRALSDRLQAVGETNVRLLQLIARQKNKSVDHVDLVELDRLDAVKADASLYRLSAEERVYRVLFLVSIGLIEEEADTVGAPRYFVGDEIAKAIIATDEKS